MVASLVADWSGCSWCFVCSGVQQGVAQGSRGLMAGVLGAMLGVAACDVVCFGSSAVVLWVWGLLCLWVYSLPLFPVLTGRYLLLDSVSISKGLPVALFMDYISLGYCWCMVMGYGFMRWGYDDGLLYVLQTLRVPAGMVGCMNSAGLLVVMPACSMWYCCLFPMLVV